MVLIKWKSIEEEDNSSKNKPKYEFEGQSESSKDCLPLDIDWNETNFSTRDPKFYNHPFQKKLPVQ